ncbi:MAG: hypothetical protein WC781_02045 [Candidatus Pacearchaeota archaeon]|jgi:hypothetical protein
METNVEEIVKECEGPKFLAHYICPWESNDRHDLSIYESLERGESIKYKATRTKGTGTQVRFPGGEFAFSVWPWKLHGYGLSWKEGDSKSQGLIIFSPNFYDKVCSWDIPENDLVSLYEDIKCIDRKEKNESKLDDIGSRIRSVGGLPYDEISDERERELYVTWNAGWAINSIIGLRNGPPRWKHPYGPQYGELANFVEIVWDDESKKRFKERKAPESCIENIFMGDYGARAVRLTLEKEIVPLNISREDVKYLISWGETKSEPKILIAP